MSEQELFLAFTPDSTILLASAGYKGATGSPAFILPLPAEPTLASPRPTLACCSRSTS